MTCVFIADTPVVIESISFLLDVEGIRFKHVDHCDVADLKRLSPRLIIVDTIDSLDIQEFVCEWCADTDCQRQPFILMGLHDSGQVDGRCAISFYDKTTPSDRLLEMIRKYMS